jgi:DNA-binding transcriptional regulator YhcF (GntR family)
VLQPTTSDRDDAGKAPVTQLVAEAVERVCREYIRGTALTALPSERQLGQELGLSRTTIRKVLSELDRQGLCYRRPGGRTRFIRREEPGISEDTHVHQVEVPHAFLPTPMQSRVSVRVMANDISSVGARDITARWHSYMRRLEATSHGLSVELIPWPILGTLPHGELGEFDVLEATSRNYSLYAPKKGWRPLDGFLSESASSLEDRIFPPLWEDATSEGKLLGIPFGAVVPCLVANKALWNQYGPEQPPTEWDWSSCLDLMERISQATGQPAFAVTNVSLLLASCGFNVYEPEASHPVAQTAAVLDRLCRFSAIFRVRYVLEPVAVGQVPFSTVMSCSVPILSSRHAGQLMVLPHPLEQGGWCYRYTEMLYMAAQAENPDRCWEVINHLTSPEIQKDMAHNRNLIPASEEAWPAYANDPEFGCLGFMTKLLRQSRTVKMSDRELLEVESEVLGPEFLRWYKARRVTERDIERLAEKLAEALHARKLVTMQ